MRKQFSSVLSLLSIRWGREDFKIQLFCPATIKSISGLCCFFPSLSYLEGLTRPNNLPKEVPSSLNGKPTEITSATGIFVQRSPGGGQGLSDGTKSPKEERKQILQSILKREMIGPSIAILLFIYLSSYL